MENNWLFATEPWDVAPKQQAGSSQAFFGAAHTPQPFAGQQGQGGAPGEKLGSAMEHEVPYGEPNLLAKVGAAPRAARAASNRLAGATQRAREGAPIVALRNAPPARRGDGRRAPRRGPLGRPARRMPAVRAMPTPSGAAPGGLVPRPQHI
jgi:hypothetical protein